MFPVEESFDLTPSIAEVKKKLRSMKKIGETIELASLLEKEKAGKNRSTLIKWFDAVVSKKIGIEQDLENITPHLYETADAVSAMQKEIRRGNAYQACWWAREVLMTPDYRGIDYCWKRLRIISIEDIGDLGIVKEIEKLYLQAKELGFLRDDGKRAAMTAVYLMAKSPAKARFFDELTEYMKLLFDGKIQAKAPEIESKTAGSLIAEMDKEIAAGRWFQACWWARMIISGEERKNDDLCWNKLLEIAKSRGIDIEVLYSQAKEFANQKSGFGAWDSVRCTMMAVFVLAHGLKDIDRTSYPVIDMKELDSVFSLFEGERPQIPDYAKDGHTVSGIKLGRLMTTPRGIRFWYLTSSRVNNRICLVEEDKYRIMMRQSQAAFGVVLTDQEFNESIRSL